MLSCSPACALLAVQTGTAEDVAKYSKRTVRVTREHNDDCKRLLQLMGIPIVEVGPAACCPVLVLASGLVLTVVPECSGMHGLLVMPMLLVTRPLRFLVASAADGLGLRCLHAVALAEQCT